jgi:membrane protease YdiL (CAAX protease family)
VSWADHLFVLLFVGVYPVVGFFSYGKMKPMLMSAPPGLRRTLYRRNMLAQWIMAAIAIGLWVNGDRALASLGLTVEVGWPIAAGLIAVAATVIFFWLQWQRARASAEVRERVRRQIVGAGELLPRTRAELQTFTWVSLTAGFCEEVLFRGFFMGYLLILTGSLWIAIAVSSVLFGMGHAYQGVKGVAVTALAGLGFASIYVVTGSLIYSMAMHAIVDINAGVLGRMVFGTDDEMNGARMLDP